MANEPAKNNPPVIPPKVTGGNPPAENRAPVVPASATAKPVAPPAPVVAATSSKVALFGGHKGGGKKRADGLVAGSPAAIEADRKKNAERMRQARAEKKSAEIPAALPSRAPATSDAPLSLAADSSGQPAPLAGVAPVTPLAPAAFPTFVPWVQAKLQKPAALLTKIVARFRDYARTKQIKKLALSEAREKKILASLKWRDEVVNDFSQSLAECATIELNKRTVPGAEHSHYLTLVMSAGELVYQELETSRLIESLVLEDRAEKSGEKKS